MPPLRLAALLVALAVCAVEAALLAAPRAPRIVVAPPPGRALASADTTAPAPAAPAPAAPTPASATVPTDATPTTSTATPTDAAADVEPSFLAHMTADDVARGVYALAAEEGAVALTAEQRARIRPLLEQGAALRARLGELRGERRRAREAWLATGTRLAATIGPERLARVTP